MYGAVVRRARLSRGLTQRQLAEVSGIEQANISAIENERRAPATETLHRLLAACGYELLAAAGARVLGLPPLGVETEPDPEENPIITSSTPLADRVRVINEVLDLSETIARSRR